MHQEIDSSRLIQICSDLFINEILVRVSDDGHIGVHDEKDKLSGIRVASHHFMELLYEMDHELFEIPIVKAAKWFIKNDNNSHNPFHISTIATARILERDEKCEYAKQILTQARPSGVIDFFTGFTEGGVLFSTAWAIKILLLLQETDEYADIILAAFRALENSWEDISNCSLKGFFIELFEDFSQSNPVVRSIISHRAEKALNEIIDAQAPDGTWDQHSDLSLLYTAYIAGNLASLDWAKDNTALACEKAIGAFVKTDPNDGSLQTSAKIFAFRECQKDSNYAQLILRFILTTNRYLRELRSDNRLVQAIASTWIGRSIATQEKLVESEARLLNLENEAGDQRSAFLRYKTQLEQIWQKSPFEKTIFIMMPFKDSTNYRELVKAIKETCESRGYTAIRTDDSQRQYHPNLWENLVINMLSARYGIAVYIDAAASGIVDRNEVLFFQNPNVAMEFGFLISRGRDVLILKDQNSYLPSDLQGFIYRPFDIENPEKTVPDQINQWLDIIEK